MVNIRNVPHHSIAKASASYTSIFDNIEGVNDGIVNPIPRWTAYESPNQRDWVQIDFNQSRTVSKAYIHFFDNKAGVQVPKSYILQYWSSEKWRDVKILKKTPISTNG